MPGLVAFQTHVYTLPAAGISLEMTEKERAVGNEAIIAMMKINGAMVPAALTIGPKLKYMPPAGDIMMAPSAAAPIHPMAFARSLGRPPCMPGCTSECVALLLLFSPFAQ